MATVKCHKISRRLKTDWAASNLLANRDPPEQNPRPAIQRPRGPEFLEGAEDRERFQTSVNQMDGCVLRECSKPEWRCGTRPNQNRNTDEDREDTSADPHSIEKADLNQNRSNDSGALKDRNGKKNGCPKNVVEVGGRRERTRLKKRCEIGSENEKCWQKMGRHCFV
jgi:hypothetical protein